MGGAFRQVSGLGPATFVSLLTALVLPLAACSSSGPARPSVSPTPALHDAGMAHIAKACAGGVDLSTSVPVGGMAQAHGCPAEAAGARSICTRLDQHPRTGLTLSADADLQWDDGWTRVVVECDWKDPAGQGADVTYGVRLSGSAANPQKSCSALPSVIKGKCQQGSRGTIVPGEVTALNTADCTVVVADDFGSSATLLDQVVPRTVLAATPRQAIG